MKKILVLMLAAIMVLSVFAGCGSKDNTPIDSTDSSSDTKVSFGSETEMMESVDGVWMNCKSGDYLIIKDGNLTVFDEASKESELKKLKKNSSVSFDDFYSDFLSECGSKIKYDHTTGCIIVSDTNTTFFELDDEETAFNDEHIMFMKDFMSESDFKDRLKEEFINIKYSDMPTNKDVQYDKYGYLGREFMISGTAELDDYYNYGYRDLEAVYFCIRIRPTGGSYSDEWYIYASRSDFLGLFDELKKGSKSLKLVAQMIYADTGSDNMATLTECI